LKFSRVLPVIFFLIFYIFFYSSSSAQNNSSSIIITGQAIDGLSRKPIKPLQIVNTKTIQRFYGDSSGNFIVQASKSDTLYVVSKGYATLSLCYKDSPLQKIYTLDLRMYRISVELPEVTVQTNRDFTEVHHEAQKLGYNKNDYMLHGYQIIQSPFTYLYQLFSTREKDKRGYAQLMNEGRKNELVKELVNNYISLDILDLELSEVNDFVDFAEVPEDFLKTTNEYDFIRYLQMRVKLFHQRKLPAMPQQH